MDFGDAVASGFPQMRSLNHTGSGAEEASFQTGHVLLGKTGFDSVSPEQ